MPLFFAFMPFASQETYGRLKRITSKEKIDCNDYRITTHGTSGESDWNGIQPAVSMSHTEPELKPKKRKTDDDGFPWWWIAFWIGVLMAIN